METSNHRLQFHTILLTAIMMISMTISSFECVFADETDTAVPEGGGEIGTLDVLASGDEGNITVAWTEEESADRYLIYLDDGQKTGEVYKGQELVYTFNDVDEGVLHNVVVMAYRSISEDELVPEGEQGPGDLVAEGAAIDVSAMIRSKLSDRTVKAAKLGFELRSLLGEPDGGHAVAQGAATDGIYAYYIMNRTATEQGRIIKTNISDHKVVARGPILDSHHANGMTYDSRRNLLVTTGCGKWKQQLSFIDPETLEIVSQKYVNYPYKIDGVPSDDAYKNGLIAISYVEEYDVYLGRSRSSSDGVGDSRTYNHLWVFDPETLSAIGHINTDISTDYPARYQDMDADEKYVYVLLSPDKNQPNNLILALDWNSEMLLPVMNGEKEYIETAWSCNNDGSGKPDAVITIPIKRESEGIFHINEEDGKEHFYLSEYYGRTVYKTVRVKKKYKVKWKKVWKKVKYKKVKINGKWKWTYKWKKVWKYKTKTKTIRKKVKDKWARDDYAYDIGIL